MNSILSMSFAAMVVTLAIAGCGVDRRAKASTTDLQGNTSDLAADLAQVNRLCPLGTCAQTAKERLGEHCRLVHFYGPLLHAASPPAGHAAETQDSWALEYDARNGQICLWLKWLPGSDRSRLDAAVISSIEPNKQIVSVHIHPDVAPRESEGAPPK